jgi:hypothetical protein
MWSSSEQWNSALSTNTRSTYHVGYNTSIRFLALNYVLCPSVPPVSAVQIILFSCVTSHSWKMLFVSYTFNIWSSEGVSDDFSRGHLSRSSAWRDSHGRHEVYIVQCITGGLCPVISSLRHRIARSTLLQVCFDSRKAINIRYIAHLRRQRFSRVFYLYSFISGFSPWGLISASFDAQQYCVHSTHEVNCQVRFIFRKQFNSVCVAAAARTVYMQIDIIFVLIYMHAWSNGLDLLSQEAYLSHVPWIWMVYNYPQSVTKLSVQSSNWDT